MLSLIAPLEQGSGRDPVLGMDLEAAGCRLYQERNPVPIWVLLRNGMPDAFPDLMGLPDKAVIEKVTGVHKVWMCGPVPFGPPQAVHGGQSVLVMVALWVSPRMGLKAGDIPIRRECDGGIAQ